ALGTNEAQLTVVLHPLSTGRRSSHQVAEAIFALPRDPAVEMAIESDRTAFALGDDFYPGLTVEFSGPDLAVLEQLAAGWAELLAGTGGFKNVTSTVRPGAPELFFRVTERSFQGMLGGGEPLTAGQVGLALRQHLTGVTATHGTLAGPRPPVAPADFFRVTERSFQGMLGGGEPLTAGQVGLALRQHLTGVTATHVTLDGQRLPVVLRPSADEVESLDSIRAFRVPGAQLTSAGGQPILDRIAQVLEGESQGAILRRDRVRVATVRAELDGIGLGEAKARAERLLSSFPLPAG